MGTAMTVKITISGIGASSLWLSVRIAGQCFALMPTHGKNGFGSLKERSRIETMCVPPVAS
jgi:hypothetical protein